MNAADSSSMSVEENSLEGIERESVAIVSDGSVTSPQVIPVVEERVKVEGHKEVSATVKIHKHVQEQIEVVDLPLQSEEVEIERVAVNQFVEEAVPIRYEGDTMIISLFEEVLVVEKRLMLREEVHVRKLHKEVHTPQKVLLRKEEVDIERLPFHDEGSRQTDSTQ